MKIVCDPRVLACRCVDQISVNILFGDSAGKKKQSTSVTIIGEIGDASKVDPLNVINVTYEVSEEQRQKFEADLKQ